MYIHVHVVLYMEWASLFFHFFFIFVCYTKAQIRCAADQHLCFRYMNSTIPLLPESHFFSTSRAKKKLYVYMSRVVRKPAFCICENKDADQLRGKLTTKLISAFIFTTRIVLSLYSLNPKFQASIHLLWLHSPVCVGPGRKPGRPVFAERGSYIVIYYILNFNFFFTIHCLFSQSR